MPGKLNAQFSSNFIAIVLLFFINGCSNGNNDEADKRPVITAPMIQPDFKDENFKRCVDDNVKANNTGLITELVTLNCANYDIVRIDGIEHLSLLERLDISSNPLSRASYDRLDNLKGVDIIRSKRLSLTFSDENFEACVHQHLSDNNIVYDFQLAQLTYLDCEAQGIRSTQGVQSLEALKKINMSKNPLDWPSYEFLKKQETIDVALSPRFSEMRSTYDANLFSCLAAHMISLKYYYDYQLDFLETLRCDNQNIINLDGIENLTALKTLHLMNNPLSTKAIAQFNALDIKDKLRSSTVNEITFADSQLKQCIMEHAAAKNWTYPSEFTDLDCRNRNIVSLAGMNHFYSLRNIDVRGNPLDAKSLRALEKNYHIKNIQQPQILGKMRFKDVNLKQCLSEIIDNSGIQYDFELTTLYCPDRNIRQVMGIEQLTNLQFINFQNNPLTEKAHDTLRALLRHINGRIPKKLHSSDFGDFAFFICVEKIAKEKRLAYVYQMAEIEHLECEHRASVIDLTAFPKLKSLSLSNSQVEHIDFSAVPVLESLSLKGTQIKQVDFTSIPGLQSLLLVDNEKLLNLEVSPLNTLRELHIHNYYYTNGMSIDLSANTALQSIDLTNVILKSTNFDHLSQLRDISLYFRPTGKQSVIPFIDLSSSPLLESVSLRHIALERIAFSDHAALKQVNLSGNRLTDQAVQEAKLTSYSDIHSLDLSANELDTIDLSLLNDLTTLDLRENGSINVIGLSSSAQTLVSLWLNHLAFPINDFSAFASLKTLHVQHANLHSVLLPDNGHLERIDLGHNALTEMTLDSDTIKHVGLASNALKTARIGGNALTSLYMDHNVLTAFDASRLPALEIYSISHNELSTLDLQKNYHLKRLDAKNNRISTVNLGDPDQIETLNLEENPLDAHSIMMLNALANTDVKRSLLLSELDLEDDTQFKACIDDIAHDLGYRYAFEFTQLDCSGRGIQSTFDLIHFTKLESVDLSNNQLSRPFHFDDRAPEQVYFDFHSELVALDLSYNQINDFLIRNHKLFNVQAVNLTGNPLSEETIAHLKHYDEQSAIHILR